MELDTRVCEFVKDSGQRYYIFIDEIHLHPLCYSELVRAYGEESEKVWQEYLTYGGLPRVLSLQDRKAKIGYLSNLFEKIYLGDSRIYVQSALNVDSAGKYQDIIMV